MSPLAFLLASGCLLQGGAEGGPPTDAAGAANQESDAGGLSELAELRARDARLEFPAEVARRALGALSGKGLDGRPLTLDEEGRAAAVLALGATGLLEQRARIEEALGSDGAPEREAAFFALAQLGPPGVMALAHRLELEATSLDPGSEALGCAALLLAAERGTSVADEQLASFASRHDTLGAFARSAQAARAGDERPLFLEPLRRYYALRWSAALRYGLVDGQRGRRALATRLFASPAFQERALWAAADVLAPETVQVHLGEAMQDGGGPGALALALRAVPDELTRAAASGLWTPPEEEWPAVLQQIDEERLERRTKKLLERAFERGGELENLAGRLLFRAGGELPWKWVAEALERGTSEERLALVEACGERGEKARIPDLAEVTEHRTELGLYGAGLVALVRLGQEGAKDTLDQLVKGPANPRRAEVVAALARVLHDKGLHRYAEEALRREDLSAGARLALEIGLVGAGSALGRDDVRAALQTSQDPRLLRACALALAREPLPTDVDALAALFPFGYEHAEASPADRAYFELNIALAEVLLRLRHGSVSGLLVAALWGEDWNRAVLAGGFLLRAGGVAAITDELAAAPATAGEEELRRAGFALGEWGGLAVVEELERDRSESDPVLQGAFLGALSGPAAVPSKPGKPRPRLPAEHPGSPGPEKGRPKGGHRRTPGG